MLQIAILAVIPALASALTIYPLNATTAMSRLPTSSNAYAWFETGNGTAWDIPEVAQIDLSNGPVAWRLATVNTSEVLYNVSTASP